MIKNIRSQRYVMWVHTKKHHIDKAKRIDTYEDDDLPMSAGEAIKKNCGSLPEWAIALKGLRHCEGLIQAALGKILGIEQTDSSNMERSKRPIGKAISKRIAKIFNLDYRIFL